MIFSLLYMEPSVIISTFLMIIILFMTLMIMRRWSKTNKIRKLPGPRKLPLIGNLHQLATGMPNRVLASMAKKYGPLFHLQLGSVQTIVVTSPAIAKEIMSDTNFADRPEQVYVNKVMTYNFRNISFAPYGHFWRQLRKVCTNKLLTAATVLSYRSIREEEVLNMIKLLSRSAAGKPVDITEMVSSMTFSITARAAFGERCQDQEAFIASMQEAVNLASGFALCELYPSIKVLQLVGGLRFKVEKLHREVDHILESIVNRCKSEMAARKANDHGDHNNATCLLEVLLSLQQEGDQISLEDANIKAVVMDVFNAGSETSATAVDWAMSEMVKNPRVMKKAQDEVRCVFKGKDNVEEAGIEELKYIKCVIKETLRLHPPLPLLFPREAKESCEINGYQIPAKTRVIINAWALARDPTLWDEAEKFNPERFAGSSTSVDYMGKNFEFIPFGAGRRICPGISFSQPNILLPLAQMLFHFDWKHPNEGDNNNLDMTETFGLTLKRGRTISSLFHSHACSSFNYLDMTD